MRTWSVHKGYDGVDSVNPGFMDEVAKQKLEGERGKANVQSKRRMKK